MAGLSHDFAFRRHDLPAVPKGDGPGRALPDSVLAVLVAALDRLEAAAGPNMRIAVRLLIDTGHRPAEVCQLPWVCLDQDRDGKYALIYTDFKNNRVGRRLAISDTTAARIIEQKQPVRRRFPDTPPADLALIPRATRSRDGSRPSSDDILASAHRRWVDDLEPLVGPDRTEFDKSAVFLYAYRHCYAQRHADAGTPVDVLRELMGHRSIPTLRATTRSPPHEYARPSIPLRPCSSTAAATPPTSHRPRLEIGSSGTSPRLQPTAPSTAAP
jgi:integrase